MSIEHFLNKRLLHYVRNDGLVIMKQNFRHCQQPFDRTKALLISYKFTQKMNMLWHFYLYLNSNIKLLLGQCKIDCRVALLRFGAANDRLAD